jgi:hypothetical protein
MRNTEEYEEDIRTKPSDTLPSIGCSEGHSISEIERDGAGITIHEEVPATLDEL